MGWGMGSGGRYVWCTARPNNPGVWKDDYNCVEDMCLISVKAQICYDWVTSNRGTPSRTLAHFFSSQYPLPFIPHNTRYNAFFSLALVPFFPPFSPSPTATLPTFFPLRLIMDFVTFKDVFSGVYRLLLMAGSKERGERRDWRHVEHSPLS